MALLASSEHFHVDYYFSKKIIKLIENDDLPIIKSSSDLLLEQLKNENYHLIIIGTVHRNFNLYKKITAKYDTAIIIHNFNFAKLSRLDLFANIFKSDVFYRLKLLLKEGLLQAPKVFNSQNKLCVLDQNLESRQFKYLPLFFNADFTIDSKSNNSEITIVIPGSVSQQRRDYKHVLNKISRFKSENNFVFYFLGKARNEELKLLKAFESKKQSNISIVYYTEKVPQETFDEVMKKANLLWCPIQQQTAFFSNQEIYGETKVSGNIGDAIKYGKLSIFPKFYESKQTFIIAEEDDIEMQIMKLNQNLVTDFQSQFNKEKISRDLEAVLQSLI